MTNKASNLLEAFNDAVQAINPAAAREATMLEAVNKLVDELTAFVGKNTGDQVLKQLVFTGADASVEAAPATLTGAEVGDVVVGVVNLTDLADASAVFESAITVDDQIQQAETDLSEKKLFVLLIASGA
jgi:hypothetical protein